MSFGQIALQWVNFEKTMGLSIEDLSSLSLETLIQSLIECIEQLFNGCSL